MSPPARVPRVLILLPSGLCAGGASRVQYVKSVTDLSSRSPLGLRCMLRYSGECESPVPASCTPPGDYGTPPGAYVPPLTEH
ncbi:hypothetical protein C8R45DRAFT_955686 [Mycena sanguinolenta]|nr:hypothetical protein C8R45DRAFT_955686 [Mycena sanguinolenta]